jgi:1-acyl-sn-glycerol-3-phosphate acyltransferase
MTIVMAGGTRRGKSTRKADSPARPRRPALGNDPFERGAAVREPAQPSASSTSSQTPTSTATPTATSTPIPTPTSTPTPAAADRVHEGAPAAIVRSLSRANLAALEGEAREAVSRLLPALRERLGSLLDLVRLLEPAERLDRYGMDVRFAQRLAPLIEFLYSAWWRVQVRGIDAVPASGPAIVVANHGGLVPWDALVLRHALRRDHPAHRDLRPLLDDHEVELPAFGAAAIRAGAVRASPEAADRILTGGGVVGVFPEGSAGARKPWRDRYTLVRFGRGGFVKVALRAGAPIVPCAIVGSEEASAGISRTGWLAERLGVPILAANPALRLAPAAALPLPSRWTLRFGEPIDVSASGREGADDPATVNALTERVRVAVQSMLDEDVASRTSVFL